MTKLSSGYEKKFESLFTKLMLAEDLLKMGESKSAMVNLKSAEKNLKVLICWVEMRDQSQR